MLLTFVEKGAAELTGICPTCGRPTRKMKSKTGKFYYSCTAYPECKFMSWDIPTGKKCPVCGNAVVKTEKGAVLCASKDCHYVEVEAPMPEKKKAKTKDTEK